jgi:hypothetical protein
MAKSRFNKSGDENNSPAEDANARKGSAKRHGAENR